MSKKESQLTTQTDFASGDLVTGLRGGANVNFSFTGMFNAMSGLTNLNQIGNSFGAPILEQPQPGVNNFRNLEPVKGISANISAENGIAIGCNFTYSASGAPLIADLNAKQYKFKTLLAGTDVTLIQTTDSVKINFTPVAAVQAGTLLSLQTPATTVTVAATPVIITGAWTVERQSDIAATTSGRITYTGTASNLLSIDSAIHIEPSTGTNKVVNLFFAKNGAIIPASKVTLTASAGAPQSRVMLWQDTFTTSDYYELWIESVDGTDLQVNSAIMRAS